MSVIKNTGIKRGDKLTATALNAEFTAVNTAFTMDEDNFRNEALDQPAFNLNATSGKSGIILKQSGSSDLITTASPVNIDANQNAVSSMVAATQLGIIDNSGAAFIIAKQNDILRVYWQYGFATGATTAKSAPYDAAKCGLCWAIWLEWQLSSGGAWAQVTGQGNMETNLDASASAGGFGSTTANLKATALSNHSLDYHIASGTINELQIFPGERNGYGQYYFKFTGDTTIYGLRLMCRGLYEPCWPPTSVQQNALRITQAAAPSAPASHNNRMTIQQLEISYLLMRNE
jgi:hypothetical protein